MEAILLTLLQRYDDLLNATGTAEDPHVPLAKEFASVKGQSTKYKLQKTFPTTAGELDCNAKRNRYKDILPFDYTRVVLSEVDGIPGSDYINANYLKGHDGKPVYIAAQGPLPQTVVDFWRMIWASNSQIIVMSCNEYELGKHKCQKYWSDVNSSQQFGEFTVQQISFERVTKEFLIRNLSVSKGGEKKTIYQFHYTSWPDHGVPSSVEVIIDMVEKMREYQPDDKNPLIIHCSAGCGRTGTICVIDYIRNLLQDEMIDELFDLKSIILDMRTQRHALVQTKEQYELVHKAAAALFRDTLKRKYGMSFDSDHTYENWETPKLDGHKDIAMNGSSQIIKPALPRQLKSVEMNQSEYGNVSEGLKLTEVKKSIKLIGKPPVPNNKPSPLSTVKPSIPDNKPSHRQAGNGKGVKIIPDSPVSNVSTSITHGHSNESNHSSERKLSESDIKSKIIGVQNQLTQGGTRNLTGGVRPMPETAHRVSSGDQPKHASRTAQSQTMLQTTPTNPVVPVAAPRRSAVTATKRSSSSAYEEISPDKTQTSNSSYEVISIQDCKKKQPPPKPGRNQLNFNIDTIHQHVLKPVSGPINDNTNTRPRKSMPENTREPCALPRATSQQEYASVTDIKSHLKELMEKEKTTGTVESAVYQSIEYDSLPNDTKDNSTSTFVPYANTDIHGNVLLSKAPTSDTQPNIDVIKPYAYTDIPDVTPKAKRHSAKTEVDLSYEDIKPQQLNQSPAQPRHNPFLEDSAYSEVKEFQQPPEKTHQDRMVSTTSTTSSWSFTDDDFQDEEDDVPVVPQRTTEMYQSIEEITEPANSIPKKTFGPLSTINKIFVNVNKIRGKIPDFSGSATTTTPTAASQQKYFVGHDVDINEAIRNATFQTDITYMSAPNMYYDIDISFPRRVSKPKSGRTPPPKWTKPAGSLS